MADSLNVNGAPLVACTSTLLTPASTKSQSVPAVPVALEISQTFVPPEFSVSALVVNLPTLGPADNVPLTLTAREIVPVPPSVPAAPSDIVPPAPTEPFTLTVP